MKKKRVVRKSADKIIQIRRKKNKRAAKAGLVILLIIVAALVLMLSPFFNISDISVKGNDYIEEETIISASGINTGENIFRMNIKNIKDKIRKIAYIDEVKVYRLLPSSVVIDVTERQDAACIRCGDGYMIIDVSGRALELTDNPFGLPEILGIESENLKEGEFVFSQQEEGVAVFGEFMDKLSEYNLRGRTTAIDLSAPDNIRFVIDGNKEVITGGNFRIDYKLMMLKAVIEEIAPSESGTIDLSTEGKALFSPAEE